MGLFKNKITMLNTWSKYLKCANKLAFSPKRDYLYISSFGVSVMDDIKNELIAMQPDRLLIGTHFPECKPGCEACDSKNRGRVINIKQLEGPFGGRLKMVEECHLKLFLTNEAVIIGGINFTGSGWDDSSVMIEDKALCTKYKRYFTDIWLKKSVAKYETTSSDYIFAFGKYKGLSYSTVHRMDPGYIQWCLKNMNWFKMLLTEMEIITES